MKTFSIRTMLILVFVCGFACWFFFVPMHVSVFCPQSEEKPPKPGEQMHLFAMASIVLQYDNAGRPAHSDIHATFVKYEDDTPFATIAISRSQYFSFDGEEWMAFPKIAYEKKYKQ